MRILSLLTFSFLVACQGGPPGMPEGEGPGLISVDPTPPEGARTWSAPVWRTGDSFTLLRGAQVKMTFTVSEVADQYYSLTDENGNRVRRSKDLGNLGEWQKGNDAAVHLLAPVDLRYHWPLWVGKRWRCGYADKTISGLSLPIEASYEVEGLDSIRTAGGNFQALRILRTSRLKADGGPFLDRTSVIWYCPDVGHEVRQMIGETAIELLDWKQAPR